MECSSQMQSGFRVEDEQAHSQAIPLPMYVQVHENHEMSVTANMKALLRTAESLQTHHLVQ